MTAQPLALWYVTSWPFQPGATAFGGSSARYLSGLAAITRWGRQPRTVAAKDNIYHRDNHRSSSLPGTSFRRIDHAPRGIFDQLFTGIAVDAAGINAAIGRHPHLQRSL